MQVFVHGGSGAAPDDPAARRAELDRAVLEGSEADDPVAAVVAAVRALESAPAFNAGVGSAVQSDATIRTDAGLMAGDGTCGAACAMENVEHAVVVAREVATETPHVLLAGERAREFARRSGVPVDRDLWTADSREQWADVDPPEGEDAAAHRAWVREHFGDSPDGGTVGAVAADGERVAAATSTGGRWFALAGRVGDVPQVGAGFYASEGAAASATGSGEAIARFGLAGRAVRAVDSGADPSMAADAAIDAFDHATGGTAGVIVMDRAGATGSATNAEAMQTATG